VIRVSVFPCSLPRGKDAEQYGSEQAIAIATGERPQTMSEAARLFVTYRHPSMTFIPDDPRRDWKAALDPL
jgi:hypothetical protein